MSSTNQSPFYKKAEAMYLQAKTNEEKLKWIEEMIKQCPKHKSSEKMLANLKTRYIKLKEKIEKLKKSGKTTKIGIKKAEMQAVLIGLTSSGKSCLINKLTNTQSLEADYQFTTKKLVIGTMKFDGIQVQIIDMPAINSEYFDQGIANTADTLIIIITKISELEEIEPFLKKTIGKRIIVFNKTDFLNENEKRKIEATLKSKKLNFVLISCKTKEGIEELKEKIWKSFNKIRIYTKEPGKEKSNEPIILNEGSTLKDVAEKIFHGFSSQIKETKITGPSSKFSNQKIGLSHIIKDKDVVEFKTK